MRIPADAVVAATGQGSSALYAWLRRCGAEVRRWRQDAGIVYMSRFYRWHSGGRWPLPGERTGFDLGFLGGAAFRGDGATFSLTLAPRADDRELLRRLREASGFTAAASSLPALADLVDPERSTPISEVHTMGNLANATHHFVRDGRPTVLGLHALGDAHTRTNPVHGRGCSLALMHAEALRSSFSEHPDDPIARALHFEDATSRIIGPWFRAAVARDARPTAPPRGTATPALELADRLQRTLTRAIQVDPVVRRAYRRTFHMLEAPDHLMTEPDVCARVLEVDERLGDDPTPTAAGPSRDAVLAAAVAA